MRRNLNYSEQTVEGQTVNKANKTDWSARARSRRFRLGAVVVLAVAIGLVLWLALRDNGTSTSATSNVTSVSAGQLRDLAASVRHPVFWLGAKQGFTYELTRTSNGSIYVRYLPPGVSLGAKEPYLTVATYPFTGAYQAIQSVANARGATRITLARGGVAEVARGDQTSAHAAYPGVDYQVEVFDPTPGTASALVQSGGLTAFGSIAPKSSTTQTSTSTPGTEPVALSAAGLKSFVNSVGHPVYWAGAKSGDSYEVTRTGTGQIFVRYLPAGVAAGSDHPYPSVATYPFPGAFAAIQAVSKQPGQVTMKLPGGALGVYDRKHPTSIHLAFPGSDYQVEVFDPSPAQARQLVSAGRITAVA
jgi:hypothetical protein